MSEYLPLDTHFGGNIYFSVRHSHSYTLMNNTWRRWDWNSNAKKIRPKRWFHEICYSILRLFWYMFVFVSTFIFRIWRGYEINTFIKTRTYQRRTILLILNLKRLIRNTHIIIKNIWTVLTYTFVIFESQYILTVYNIHMRKIYFLHSRG